MWRAMRVAMVVAMIIGTTRAKPLWVSSRSEQLSVRTHALPQSGSRSSATAPAAPSRVVGGSVRCAAHRGTGGRTRTEDRRYSGSE